MIDIKDLEFQQGDFKLSASLNVPQGELVTLLGPSGSGKSTLLRLIAGFLSPLKGSISYDHKEISQLPPYDRGVGFLFQDLALFPHLNVEGNILFGLQMQHRSKKEQKKILQEQLELIGLQGFSKRPVHKLSGGEKQRVALARALAPHPGCLLLDEPLSALDVEIRKRLGLEIRSIQQKKRLTTLWVTHDQEQAMNISDKIILIKEGEIIEEGTPEELYLSPKDPWTALFLGEGVLLPVQDIEQGKVQSPWGDFEIAQSENKGKLLIRPEWLEITPGKGEALVSRCLYGQRGYRIEGNWLGYPFCCYSHKSIKSGSGISLKVKKYHRVSN